MRIMRTAIAGTLASILAAGTAFADSANPIDPGAPTRDPAPAVAPSLAPTPGPRPTAFANLPRAYPLIVEDMDNGGSFDATLDQMLGVMPASTADEEHAKLYIVNDDGDIECWDLDTFFPEPC